MYIYIYIYIYVIIYIYIYIYICLYLIERSYDIELKTLSVSGSSVTSNELQFSLSMKTSYYNGYDESLASSVYMNVYISDVTSLREDSALLQKRSVLYSAYIIYTVY